MALREENGAHGYHLIYTRADRNIWFSMSRDEVREDDEGTDGKLRKQADGKKEERVRIKVVRMTKPLDRDRAIRVNKLWARMLKDVRYPDAPFSGWLDDSDAFEFRGMGMYGETHTPSRGAPRMLADVGESLILYCKSRGGELTKNLTLLDKRCEELERFLDAEERRGRRGK